MAGHRLASDRAGDVSGRPRSVSATLQVHVQPVRSKRIETAWHPPCKTTGQKSSGHYPNAGLFITLPGANLFSDPFYFFVAKRDAGHTKPGSDKASGVLYPAPCICKSRIPLILIHADKDRVHPRIGDAVPQAVRGHYPERDCASVLYFFTAAATNVAAGTIMFSWAFLPGEPFWVRTYHWQAGLYGLLDLTERAAKGYSYGFGIKISRPPASACIFIPRPEHPFSSATRLAGVKQLIQPHCLWTHGSKKKLPPIWKPQENIKILSQGKLANPPIITAW